MSNVRWPAIFARFHRILALVIGVQLLAWTASGLFFTIWPIEVVRGEHLLKPEGEATVAPSSIRALDHVIDEPIRSAHVVRLANQWVWRVGTQTGTELFAADTGDKLSPLSETKVREIIAARWANAQQPISVQLVTDPAREWGRPGPVWQARFGGPDKARLYIDPKTGDSRVVRTDLWRAFDVMWRFHIMDLTGEDRFDTWWLKLAAFLGLATALAGMLLLLSRISRGMLFR